ncbi:DUF4135 domain-containing protein, partial [Macrococcoides caseolyticum]|uniref:DUF4135 domain-containing protein n=1 Tax=Macrococcoides caseolyticum TaxID=69966 RepID=UPI001F32DCCB
MESLELPIIIESKIDNMDFSNFYRLLLKKAHQKYNSLDFPMKSPEVFLNQYLDFCKKVFNSTLIYEINNLRISNKLQGNNKYERYNYFNELLKLEDNFIIKKYTEGMRLINNYLDKSLLSITKILNYLKKDKSSLNPSFVCENLISIEFLGDSHLYGEAVSKLNFIENSLIFKPRDLEIDKSFQELLEWFNNKTDLLDFKILNIINNKNYGWVEFIKDLPCNNQVELNN